MLGIQNPAMTSYPVEISGWDHNEDFFVEQSELRWSEEDGKMLRLRHEVRDRAVLFVRLTSIGASAQSFPIAYQAETVKTKLRDGRWEIRLTQLHPRFGTQNHDPAVPELATRHNGHGA